MDAIERERADAIRQAAEELTRALDAEDPVATLTPDQWLHRRADQVEGLE